MKIKVTYKDPDGPYESLKDAAYESLKEIIFGLSNKEAVRLIQDRTDEMYQTLVETVGSSEYITIEIDTETKTAVVLKD